MLHLCAETRPTAPPPPVEFAKGRLVQIRPSFMSAAAVAMVATMLPAAGVAQDPGNPLEVGQFSPLFVEPTIEGQATSEECIAGTDDRTGQERQLCKPAAGTVALLTDGRYLYHNALEGTEEVQLSIVAEYGSDSINDQSRVLDLNDGNPTWLSPSEIGGGAKPDPSGEETLLPPGTTNDADVDYNSGALFCSDITMLPDGRLMSVGGTNYYTEPAIVDADGDGDADGAVELVGLNEARIFDPATNDWTQTGSMTHGRWYPTLVTQADGNTFVASGVTKLLKPVYTSHPLDSGDNVQFTETYDPETGEWTVNGEGDVALMNDAARPLPLYPRLHMLPNGNIYYNAAGQVFNPAGQSYLEGLWNIAASYDPDSQSWSDLGIPGMDTDPTDGNPVDEIGGAVGAGFRGSTTSIMMTLKQNETGTYDKAEFLTAGGILGVSPGSYQAVPFSRIDTVEVDGENEQLSSRNTGSLAQPRWYGQSVLLADDSVIVFSGASADEVVNPGTGVPVTITERFDPATETWTQMAEQTNPRTYHNTAILMPDGRVLVGGHAPISTAYLNNTTLPLGTSPADRDPTFQFYSPPYIFEDRPDLTRVQGVVDNGRTVKLRTADAATVDNVLIVREPTLTHLVDGDQRSVEVPITRRNNNSVEITIPESEVLPPGGYMIFLREENADGEMIPSEAQQVLLGERASVPSKRLDGENRVATSVKVSQDSFTSADTVLIARSDNYPDALAGAPLAAKEEAPLLLTAPNALDSQVSGEIARLGATRAIVLGGPEAIDESVVSSLEADGLTVERVAGENRFATAVEIADALGATASSAYLTKGADPDPARGWEDALTVAPLAAFQGRPILLTRTDSLPSETADALESQKVDQVTVVGGLQAVSAGVESQAAVGRQTRRLAGVDRYDTSAIVHREAMAAGMSAANLWIATGRNFPDSLSAGPAVAAAGDSLLLVDGQALSNAERVKPRLRELAGITQSLTTVGGEVAVREAVERAVLDLLRVA